MENKTNKDKNLEVLLEELGNLQELDLPEGFHLEIMTRVRGEAVYKLRKRQSLFKLVGGLATAAALVSVTFFLPDFSSHRDFDYYTQSQSQADQIPQIARDGLTEPATAAVQPPAAIFGFNIPDVAVDESDDDSEFFALEQQAGASTRLLDGLSVGLEDLEGLGSSLDEIFDRGSFGTILLDEKLPPHWLITATPGRFFVNYNVRIITEDVVLANIGLRSLTVGLTDGIFEQHFLTDGAHTNWIGTNRVIFLENLEDYFADLNNLGVVRVFHTFITDILFWGNDLEAQQQSVHLDITLTDHE